LSRSSSYPKSKVTHCLQISLLMLSLKDGLTALCHAMTISLSAETVFVIVSRRTDADWSNTMAIFFIFSLWITVRFRQHKRWKFQNFAQFTPILDQYIL